MKNFKKLALLLILFGNSLVQSRTSNTIADGSAIDEGTEASKVDANSAFTVSVYDQERNILYLGEGKTETKGAKSIMRADFSGGGKPVLTGIATGDLEGKKIKKLMLTDDGDLVVALNNTSVTSFYVIKNPHEKNNTTSELLSQEVNNAEGEASPIAEISLAGKDVDLHRIVVIVSGKTDKNDLSSDPEKSCMRVYAFNSTEGTFAEKTPPLNDNGNSKYLFIMKTDDSVANTVGKALKGISGEVNHGIVTPTNIANLSGFWWDNDLQCLYYGIWSTDRTAGVGVQERSLLFRTDFSDSSSYDDLYEKTESFSPQNTDDSITNVLTQRTDFQKYRIHTIQTFRSRCNDSSDENKKLTYLMAQVQHSDAGTTETAARCVYVFPVADKAEGENKGQAAKVDASNTETRGTISRAAVPATALETFATKDSMSGEEISDSNAKDVRALVGGAPLPMDDAENIKQVTMINDTVFAVCVDNDSLHYLTGVYASSPIYRVGGEIAGWTSWQRVFASGISESSQNAIHAIYPAKNGEIIFVGGNQDATIVNWIGKIDWNKSSAAFTTAASPEGGWAGKLKTDFSSLCPWMAKELNPFWGSDDPQNFVGAYGTDQSNLSIVGGHNAVAIFSSGNKEENDSSGVVTTSQSSLVFNSSNGLNVGFVYCADVAQRSNSVEPNSTHGFIFVGGEKGLFVLRKTNGNGFKLASSTLFSNLSGELDEMSFKKIPGITGSVHALHSTQKYLYVMTAKQIYRIRLHTNSGDIFGNGGTDTKKYDGDATMFSNDNLGNPITPLEPSADLSNMTAADYSGTTYSVSDIEANSSSSQSFKAEVLVIQKVMSAGTGEYFTDMVGFTSNASIFVASILSSGKSRIYYLQGDRGKVEAGTDNVIPETGKQYIEKSFYIRKLALRYINYKNNLLNDVGVTPSWIDKAGEASFTSADGLYSSDAPGVIGNLFVFEGDSVSKKTKTHVYEIKGFVYKNVIANGKTMGSDADKNDVFFTTTVTSAEAGLAEITTATTPYDVLLNAVDLVTMPTIFGSTYNSRNLLNLVKYGSLGVKDSSTEGQLISSLSAAKNAYSFLRLESGALLLLSDAGIKMFE